MHTQPSHAAAPSGGVGEAVQQIFSIKEVLKADGARHPFDPEKLRQSIWKSFQDAGVKDAVLAEKVVYQIIGRLVRRFDGHTTPKTSDIREVTISTLIDCNLVHVVKKYSDFVMQRKNEAREPRYGNGISVERYFTKPGVHPFDVIEWEKRDAAIKSDKGEIVFEQKGVELPKFYSQTATNIIVSKYFRGRLGTPERESSVRQMVTRVAHTIADWGRFDGYFATPTDAENFEMELTHILVNQMAAFNSPVWFNVGVNPHPQCSACFINSVDDDMRSILNLAVTEGMLFKYGSGTGSNLSRLRSSREQLSNSSGRSSGPVSFMKGFDAFAGVIKSGGKTRRAAKMVILDIDHPDVREFVWCKVEEEKKAWALIEAGYDASMDGAAYSSIFFQNANNTVRVTDEFMQAVVNNQPFDLIARTTKKVTDTVNARELFREVSEAAWMCGDPGIQMDTTINRWHTCKNTDRIYASNPCSEYMFLDDSACNLASLNLMRFRRADGEFDVAAFNHGNDVVITAMEIIIGNSAYPSPAIEHKSHEYRPLGLGYANLGALLMCRGLAYSSDEGRNFAAAITSLQSGRAYYQSAKIAERLGPFAGYALNREPCNEVIRMHRDASYQIPSAGVPEEMLEESQKQWDAAVSHGEKFGYRNAQISVLAPTGTIAFLMDCDTTGIEPDIALVKYKWLVGGGMLKLVNQSVPEALEKLGYSREEREVIMKHIDQNDTIEGAPGLKPEHLPVFDCAFKPKNGTRVIAPIGHIKMMAAVQPFLSGAISKTVNMPNSATVDEIMDVYIESWKIGLKAVAIYRDGSKKQQALTTSRDSDSSKGKTQSADAVKEVVKIVEVNKPRRNRLPDERRSMTHKFSISGHEGYVTIGLYDNGQPGEMFVTM
ncbi:MAG: vitamin B12-dependent ribonucleotide reductase, partial [bacterium]